MPYSIFTKELIEVDQPDEICDYDEEESKSERLEQIDTRQVFE